MPFELRGFNLDYDMRLWRNRCIIALFIQIISSIAGFSFYFMRKVIYCIYNKKLPILIKNILKRSLNFQYIKIGEICLDC